MNFSVSKTQEKRKELTALRSKIGKKMKVTVLKIVMLALLAVGILGFSMFFGVANGVIESAPDLATLDVAPQGYVTTVYDSAGAETIKLVSSGANRVYVGIDELPEHLGQAFVAIEDERFFEHNGIDTKGIIRAFVVGMTSGSFSEGASTITQQLIKNNVFEEWVSQTDFLVKLKRKVQEQYLAVQLEKKLSKEQILEYYLNTINLGQNTLGVQAASQRYFNKDASELTISESAVVAAITQNPVANNPVTHPDTNADRRTKVLDKMLELGFISEQEHAEALADDVYLRIQNINDTMDSSSVYSYFVDELTEQVMDALMVEKGYTETQAYNLLYRGGLSIYTTQDMAIQQICDEEFADSSNYPRRTRVVLSYRLTVTHADGSVENFSDSTMAKYFKEAGQDFSLVFSTEDAAYEAIEQYKASILQEGDQVAESVNFTLQPQASCVIMEPSTGYVKAIVGGRGEKSASLTLNRATNTTRQPGSTFKVLSTFTAALNESGMTLATTYVDEPYSYANGQPVRNYYSGYYGLSTIRKAITRSMNIVTVKCLTDISPKLGYDYLLKYGFTTLVDEDIVQSLALGGLTNGVTNLELTAAFSAIANKGTYIKPIFFTKIVDHDGNVLIDNTPQTTAVMKETTAYLLTDAMEDVLDSSLGGTGAAARFDSMPIAGKTGTTSEDYDIWFSGFTPYYCCSVWGGYDVNTSLEDTNYHKVLWRKIMQRVHENLERREFEVPEGITTATVCSVTGKLARSGCPSITEYFEEGTEPTAYCGSH
ncbi:MAG: transglycosylase domain-containing protein [Lachnospiraceae bacterium]